MKPSFSITDDDDTVLDFYAAPRFGSFYATDGSEVFSVTMMDDGTPESIFEYSVVDMAHVYAEEPFLHLSLTAFILSKQMLRDVLRAFE